MARTTVASLTTHVAALEAALAAKAQELAHLQSRVKHDYVEVAEYRRVQAVLRSTQQFMAKYKREARPQATAAKRPFSERAKAYMAATGERSVTMPKLLAWEQAHA